MLSSMPVPPVELAMRAGCVSGSDVERLEYFDWVGAVLKQAVLSALPVDWTWEGRRALDFGCGTGRVLRHFKDEAQRSEISGCDIDQASIAWTRERLAPPFYPFVVSETPGLPQRDGYFDLVWALSVFTHLTEHWAGWLLELHRVLKPSGYLIATFMGENMAANLGSGGWNENRVGMLVTGAGRPWSEGGPSVFHSEWWLRAHWGRAFDVSKLERNQGMPGTHGLIVLRRRPVRLTRSELERAEPDEARELAAAEQNLSELSVENQALRREIAALRAGNESRATARIARGVERFARSARRAFGSRRQ